jgi:ornithine carbamoyltransferase
MPPHFLTGAELSADPLTSLLDRHAAAIGLRTGDEATLAALAEHAGVPVVNMLSPRHRPCQALADLLTLREAFGALELLVSVSAEAG